MGMRTPAPNRSGKLHCFAWIEIASDASQLPEVVPPIHRQYRDIDSPVLTALVLVAVTPACLPRGKQSVRDKATRHLRMVSDRHVPAYAP